MTRPGTSRSRSVFSQRHRWTRAPDWRCPCSRGRSEASRGRWPSGRFASMPTPRRRTPRSKIDEERAHLLEELRASEATARPLIESYVTAERIEYLGGDPIVRRL